MAGTNTSNSTNQTMRHEQAKASVSGSSERRNDQGGFDRNRNPEQGGMDRERENKSAIGGGETRSETGEPGRARNELDQGETRNR